MVQVANARTHVLRWIVVIGLILAVPLIYFVAQWTRNKFLHELDNRANDELKVNLAYLQSRMDHIQTMIQIVATDDRVLALLNHPADPQLAAVVNRFLARLDMAAGSIPYVLTLDGEVVASANWDTPESFIGQNFSFRPYFKAAAGGKAGQYAAIGTTSGKLGYYASRPIRLNGVIAGVAVTKTDPQDLVLPYARQERAFIITDPHGIAIISSPRSFLYHTISPLPPAVIETLEKERPFPDVTIESLSTRPIETIERIHLITLTRQAAAWFRPASREFVLAKADVPRSGWSAYILWPIHDLNATLVQSLLISLLLLIATLLLTLFAAERWRHMKSMHEQAIRDPLTGLYTRLYMVESANLLLAAHDRNNIPGLSAIMFDLDRFKAVNDQFGHSAGDNVLVKVAEVVLKECRESDIAIRYGGEELLIFVSSGNSRQVLQFAERIREQIKALDVYLNGRRVPITISGGIAAHLPGEPLEKLIDRADQVMYLAKQNGRDQVRREDD